jgi:hypothetical protein
VRIPNGDRADLGDKLEEYCLNSTHRHGQHKARVFESVLGITGANASVLRAALLQQAANSEDAVHKGNNGYGDVYELRFPLVTAKGTARVFSAWIIRSAEDFPRLVTCFIL